MRYLRLKLAVSYFAVFLAIEPYITKLLLPLFWIFFLLCLYSFFKIYDKFHEERNNLRIEISKNRLDLKKTDLSDKEALAVIKKEMEIKKKMVDLEEEYLDKYLKVISANQVIQMYKAEDEFNRIMMRRIRERHDNSDRSERHRRR